MNAQGQMMCNEWASVLFRSRSQSWIMSQISKLDLFTLTGLYALKVWHGICFCTPFNVCYDNLAIWHASVPMARTQQTTRQKCLQTKGSQSCCSTSTLSSCTSRKRQKHLISTTTQRANTSLEVSGNTHNLQLSTALWTDSSSTRRSWTI